MRNIAPSVLKSTCVSLLFMLVIASAFCQSLSQSPQNIYEWKDNFSERESDYSEWIGNHMSYLQGQTDANAQQQLKYLQRLNDFWGIRLGSGSEHGDLNNTYEFGQALRELSLDAPCTSNAGNWSQVGPSIIYDTAGNLEMVNGVVTAVYMNPLNNLSILIGTNHSGIWKTSNGGINWVNVTDNLNYPRLSAGNFSVSPSNTNKIIAASDLGKVLMSDDAGDTWYINEALYAMNEYRNIQKVQYVGSTGLEILACSDRRLFRSVDGGATWIIILEIPDSDDDLLPFMNTREQVLVDFIQGSNGRIIVTTEQKWGNEGQVFYSDEGGVNWADAFDGTLLTGPNSPLVINVTRISQADGDRFFLIVNVFASSDSYYIYETLNGGMTFSSPRIVNLTEDFSRGDKLEVSFVPGTDDLYFGQVEFYRLNADGTSNILTDDPSTSNSVEHDDIRDIQYIQNTSGEHLLVIGHDGGISTYNPLTSDFINLNGSDLTIAESKGGGVMQKNKEEIIIGNQDGGTQHLTESLLGDKWYFIRGADGGKCGFSWDGTKRFDAANGSFVLYGFGYNVTNTGLGMGSALYSPLALSNDYSFVIKGCNGSPSGGLIISSNNPAVKTVIPGSKFIHKVEIAKSNNDVIYAADSKLATGGTPNKLLKSTDRGVSFSDFTSGIVFEEDGTNTGIELSDFLSWNRVVTAIQIDPLDEDKICIGIGGAAHPDFASDFDRIKVLKTQDGGLTWHAFSAGLPPLPVVDLLYIEHSNDCLIAATDIGVYYKTADMTEWQCLRQGTPSMMATELDYNYCTKTLYCMTYGRGVWSTLLPAGVVNEPIVVDSDETWSDYRYVPTDVIVEDGATLTITGEMFFASDRAIRVMQGGTLIVDGGTLSDNCEASWVGVQVQGDPAGQGGFGPGNPGVAIVRNGGIIEHASTALSNFIHINAACDVDWDNVGGLLYTRSGAVLRNNRRDVSFLTYQNVNSDGDPKRDRSLFTETEFIINDDYPYDNPPEPSVTAWQCNGMQFKGCSFVDERNQLPLHLKRTGIHLSSSTARVDRYCTAPIGESCDDMNTPTTFTELYQGIESIGETHPLFMTEVKRSDFIRCWNGIYLLNSQRAEIWDNDFEVKPIGYAVNDVPSKFIDWPVGIYLHSQTRGYMIEENRFYPFENSTDPSTDDVGFGIVASTYQGANERLYKNSFKHLSVGLESLGSNREQVFDVGSGLEARCNTFDRNTRDIAILKGDIPSAFYGMDLNQGAEEAPTLNTFIVDQALVNISNELGSTQGFTNYYYDEDAAATDKPTESFFDLDHATIQNPQNIALIGTFEADAVGCPSQQGGTGTDDHKVKRLASQSAYDQQAALLAQVVDGGDTEGLQSDVILTTDIDAWQKYLSLMSKAGYVSEEVLKEVAYKEDGFSLAMIRNVLVANKHSAKSEEVEEKLEQRTTQLPEYMMAQIKAGLADMSPKDYLQMLQDRHHSDFALHTDGITHNLLRDSISADSISVLIANLEATGDPTYDYQAIALYDALGQSGLASAKLAIMAADDRIQDGARTELERYTDLRTEMQSWPAQALSKGELDAGTLDELAILASTPDRAGTMALSILLQHDTYDYDRPVQLPADIQKRLRGTAKPDAASARDNSLSIYPNPAQDHYTIHYRLTMLEGAATLRIIDALGVVQEERRLIAAEDQILFRNKLEPGAYQIELRNAGRIVHTEKLIIK